MRDDPAARDIRESQLYREAETLYTSIWQPGTGQISDALAICAHPEGDRAAFSGVIVDRLEGTPSSRICQVNLTTGKVRVLTFGPNTDRLPKYSPDGRQIAFLSDRTRFGEYQLYLLDPGSGAARATPEVDGWIEYLHWSPDSRQILLGVAGHGADIAGGHGAITSQQVGQKLPSW